MKLLRIGIFAASAAIIGIGFYGVEPLGKAEGMPFLLGCLTLGGGLLISGLFSIKLPWHGVMAAGVLALLGFGRGLINFPGFAQFLLGERERGVAPAFEFFVMLLCAIVLVRVIRTLAAERARMGRGE